MYLEMYLVENNETELECLMLMVVTLNSRSKVRDILNQKIVENMTKINTKMMGLNQEMETFGQNLWCM